MITALRSRLGTWFARVLFAVLVVAFSAWGIGDVVRRFGSETWVARVGDVAIEPPELQQAYQTQLNRIARMLGGQVDPTPEMKRGILGQALDQLIRQHAVNQQIRHLHIVVPEAALGHDILAMPAFRGPEGQFSRQAFQVALRNAGLSEGRFMDSLRQENASRQLIEPIRMGLQPSELLTREVFLFTTEQREAGLVELHFSAATAAEPSEAQMQRWYDNHPELYTTPEYRRIKAVILSPDSLKDEIEITDEEIRAAYEARRGEFVTPEKRSAEIIVAQDEAKARELARQWRGGADWEAMQKAAGDAGGAAVALQEATEVEFPDPDLAKAVSGASPGVVTEPVKTATGWQVLRVTHVIPGITRSLADTRDELHAHILAEKATDVIYRRATEVEDTLAAGTGLDQMPGDLGLAGVVGTMDAQGETLEGRPAPIPGSAELRKALITAAFQANQGDPPRLQEVPAAIGAPSYFAVSVEEITPPGRQPFAAVSADVKDDVMHAERRRAHEEAATKLVEAVKAGQSLHDAATVAGVSYRELSATGRAAPAAGLPPEAVAPLFSLKQGEATMVATADAFVVITPLRIIEKDPKTDEEGLGRIRQALTEALANDAEMSLVAALRNRSQPRVNQKVLDSFIQP